MTHHLFLDNTFNPNVSENQPNLAVNSSPSLSDFLPNQNIVKPSYSTNICVYDHNVDNCNITKNNDQEIIDYLRLIRSENIGPNFFWRLLEIFGDANIAVREANDFFRKIGSKKKIKITSIAEAENEIEKIQKFGAKIIIASDPNYPKILKTIYDAPPLLTVKGDLSFFNKPNVAIVGARNCSFSASNIAKKIAVDLGENSFITVSGLARGVDVAVHEASILSGTIAVIAGGIDNIYPFENKRIYQQISQYGLLISEMPFGSPPKSNYFIKRNRIISGLSSSLIVVEAGLKSGSLATARFALEQGREVYACAGSPFDHRCAGVNQLIKDGAKIITNIVELVSDISQDNLNFKSENFKKNNVKNFVQDDFKIKDLSSNDNLENNLAAVNKKNIDDFINDDELQNISDIIANKINNQAISIEEIIFDINKSAKLVNIALMQLEFKGKIIINNGMVIANEL
jgi:DNA processing protein